VGAVHSNKLGVKTAIPLVRESAGGDGCILLQIDFSSDYIVCSAVLLVHVLRRTHEPFVTFVTHRDASMEKRQHVRARG
jgi:hypothetical protein